MNKLILLSVIIASVVVAVRAARHKNARVGLRTMIKQVALVNVIYLLALLFVWGRF